MIVVRFVFEINVQLKDNNHKFEKYVQLHTYTMSFFKVLLTLLNMIY